MKYAFRPAADVSAEWVVWLDGQNLRMSFAAHGPNLAEVELLIPFDPRAMGTTVLAEDWGERGAVKAPLIISALDMGQLRLSNVGKDERLDCTFTGSRQHKRIDLRVEVLSGTTLTRSLEQRGHTTAVIDINPDSFRRLGPGFSGAPRPTFTSSPALIQW